MPRAKPQEIAQDDGETQQLDEQHETATLSGAIPEGDEDFLASLAKDLGYKDEEGWERDPQRRLSAKDYLKNTPRVLAEAKERGERAAAAAAAAIEEDRRRIREEATKVIETSDDREERREAAKRLAENAGPPPETQAWLAKNPWFHTDPDAQALVVATCNRMAANKAPIAQQLEEAERVVRKRFPEHFGDQGNGQERPLSEVRRQTPQAPQVREGSRANGSQTPKERGWAEVPRVDREAFDRHLLKHFMNKGLTQDEARAQYGATYWRANVSDPSERGDEPYPMSPQPNIWAKRRGRAG